MSILKHLPSVNWICQEHFFKLLLQTWSYQPEMLVLLPLSPVQKGCAGGQQKVLGGSVWLLPCTHWGCGQSWAGAHIKFRSPAIKVSRVLPSPCYICHWIFLPWHLTKLFLTPNWAHCYSSEPHQICNSSIWITSGKQRSRSCKAPFYIPGGLFSPSSPEQMPTMPT